MAQESKAESGRRFAKDMRRVRETRHVTVDDLHEETKISLGLLEAFEESALFDHPQFNRVYLRSFVRTYANVIGIEPEIALEALEESLSDRYTGSLAVEYLGEDAEPDVESEPSTSEDAEAAGVPTPVDEPEAEELEEDDVSFQSKSELADQDEGVPPPADRPEIEHEAEEPGQEPDPSATSPEYEDDDDDDDDVSPAFVATEDESQDDLADQPYVEEEDDGTEWSAQSPPGATKTPHRAAYRDRPGGPDWRWLAGLAAVIVVGVIVWIIVSVTGRESTPPQDVPAAMDTTATVDTTMVEDPDLASRAVMPTLGDTINVQLIAVNDKVDPIRVTVDDDLRRPYWLDQGDSMLFRPTNRLVLEELLDNIGLRVEGVEYPTDRRDASGRIVITRDSLRAYYRSNEAE